MELPERAACTLRSYGPETVVAEEAWQPSRGNTACKHVPAVRAAAIQLIEAVRDWAGESSFVSALSCFRRVCRIGVTRRRLMLVLRLLTLLGRLGFSGAGDCAP